MQINPTKTILIILDGWGEAPASSSNAVTVANTPFVDSLYQNFPHSSLLTCGENVGLPEGQMGNSEVGHLNIGAGRIVYQELALINKAIREKTIDKNPVLNETFQYCLKSGKQLHFIGLVSDGGVHSHQQHLIHLCKMAHQAGVKQIFIHAFTDGRDTDPNSGLQCLNQVEREIQATGARIVSVIGRYYAMDRDKRWERVKEAYDLMVNGKGVAYNSVSEAVTASYKSGVSDEFIKPALITDADHPPVTIGDGDAVVCFNFRTDRCREITHVLTQEALHEYNMHPLTLRYVTMTRYDKTFKDVHVVYEKDNLVNTLGEVLAEAGKTQIRIAETEKYPHVTFFFNGGREAEFAGETRIMVPSPKVATYDLQPEMSAMEVTDRLLKKITEGTTDFICLNYANADMVGHTGDFDAAVKAVETVDHCASQIAVAAMNSGYTVLITADHGNADRMKNEDGSPNTAHTLNPVPLFLLSKQNNHLQLQNGILADLAPTILMLMGVSIPAEMTGDLLLREK